MVFHQAPFTQKREADSIIPPEQSDGMRLLRSFYGDAFGEVARFIHIAATGHGDMIREELQWHAGENGID